MYPVYALRGGIMCARASVATRYRARVRETPRDVSLNSKVLQGPRRESHAERPRGRRTHYFLTNLGFYTGVEAAGMYKVLCFVLVFVDRSVQYLSPDSVVEQPSFSHHRAGYRSSAAVPLAFARRRRARARWRRGQRRGGGGGARARLCGRAARPLQSCLAARRD